MTSTRRLTLALATGLCLTFGTGSAQTSAPRLAFPASVPAAHRATLAMHRRVADSLAARAPQPLPVLGRTSAPITIEYFADLQCPACRMFELQADTTLAALAQAGTVRVIYYDFPLPFHPGAPDAAMLAHCTPKPALQRVRRVLYESQEVWGSAPEPSKVFRRVLEVAGIRDRAAVLACYDEGRYVDLLRFGFEESQRRQLTARGSRDTPQPLRRDDKRLVHLPARLPRQR